jgi:simple sugar transport system ATP-binding protein
LSAKGLARRGALHPLDIEVRRGEVTGLAGLLGSGRTETARLLFGIDRRDAGEVIINGKSASLHSPRDAVARGLAFCSEDRKVEGILPNLSVRENLIIALQAKRGGWRALSREEQEKLCAHYIAAMRIKTPNAEVPIKNLSGGNQQKVLLARWLATQPELIILDEPQSGLDPVNMVLVRNLLRELKDEGRTILLSTHMMGEAEKMADEIILIHRGKVVLDGSLDEVRGSFGRDTLHMEFEGDGGFLEALPQVKRAAVSNNTAEIALAEGSDPQKILEASMGRLRIRKFEVAAPSLEEIFIERVGAESLAADEVAR